MAAATSNPRKESPPSAKDEAIERLSAGNLHQRLWLPENASHERLRVTYSTTTNFADTNLPVVLFCSPMFGSRWLNTEFERLAVLNGVRVICVDRPGMGGSTRVPLKIRIAVWLEVVPELLKHLDVKHVSLLAHSAGTIYCLNTLYHLRSILDPNRPYLALIAPWVHNEQSKVFLWNAASKLPISMIDSWNSVGKFVQTQIAPSISWSGGAFTAVSGLFSTKTDDALTPGRRYGTTDEVGKEMEKLQVKYFFEEDTTAANEEAKMCLKKDGLVAWDVCDNYETYVRTLCTRETEMRRTRTDEPRLKVQVYYAESDVMIGKGGQSYFDECWSQSMVAGAVDYSSKELPGTDHDSALIDQEKGAIRHIFAEIGKTG